MKKILLVACGSFDPITNMHLRMFEVARDALHQMQECRVVGVVSPVSDNYLHKELAPAADRIEMIKLALKSSDWIKLDTWEANQEDWLETVHVLNHEKEVASSYFQPCDTNHNDLFDAASAAKKRRTADNHDINKNVGRDEFKSLCEKKVEDEEEIEVRLLCGADVLQSFAVPNLWKTAHIEEIVKNFGLVVCKRVGFDLDKFIYEFDVLSLHKSNIIILTDWITNEISSTKIRRALKRGESIKYLVQDSVIDYIQQKQLYNVKLANEVLDDFRQLMEILDESSTAVGFAFKKEKNYSLKHPDMPQNLKNPCSYHHYYVCCCCWFLDDNPLLDVGGSSFQHHHHYHLPPHPHTSLHSNIHHCHPLSVPADQQHSEVLGKCLPQKLADVFRLKNKAENIPAGPVWELRDTQKFPVRNETNV